MIEVSLQKMAQIHNLSQPSCVPRGSFIPGILFEYIQSTFQACFKNVDIFTFTRRLFMCLWSQILMTTFCYKLFKKCFK